MKIDWGVWCVCVFILVMINDVVGVEMIVMMMMFGMMV